jgi:hypothetical protein
VALRVTSPVAALSTISIDKIGRRDAVVPFSGHAPSLAIRVDLLPREQGGNYGLLDGAVHTAVGLAPDYAVRLSTFAHAAVNPQLLLRTGHVAHSGGSTTGAAQS